MTTYLSSELVTQLQPVCGSITSVTQFQTKSSNSKSRREEAEAQKQLDHKVSYHLSLELQGPVVQSIVSLTSPLRGQLVKCFTTL